MPKGPFSSPKKAVFSSPAWPRSSECFRRDRNNGGGGGGGGGGRGQAAAGALNANSGSSAVVCGVVLAGLYPNLVQARGALSD